MLFGSRKSKAPKRPEVVPTKPTQTQRRLVVTVTRTDIMSSIAEATAACNNLLNSLRLVNPEVTRVQDNQEITEVYTKAKQQQIEIIKNTRRCTEDDLMGTLLEVNERLVSALGLYAEMVQRADIRMAISISGPSFSSTPSHPPFANDDSSLPPWVLNASSSSNGASGSRSAPFNFQKEKPLILRTIAETSQAAINLNNALKLVDLERTTVQADTKVQGCWDKANEMRKKIVGYIELVEDEEVIGTLLETNERLSDALTMYDKLSDPDANVGELREELDQFRFQHYPLDGTYARTLPTAPRPTSTYAASAPVLNTISSSQSSPALRSSSYPTSPRPPSSAPAVTVAERSASPPPPSYNEVMSIEPELSFESGSLGLASHTQSSTPRRSPNLEEIAPNGEHVLSYNYEVDEDPFADPPEHGLQ